MAMESIDSDPLADPANLTVGAVIDVLGSVIVVEFAHVTVVMRQATPI